MSRRNPMLAAITTAASPLAIRAGGVRQHYRIIDFKRDKTGIPAKVVALEYDPNRHCFHRPSPVRGRREALYPGSPQPQRGRLRDRPPKRRTSSRAIRSASRASRWVRWCTIWSSAPGKGGQMVRSGRHLCPGSGPRRRVLPDPHAFGRSAARAGSTARPRSARSAIPSHENITIGKAGRARKMGNSSHEPRCVHEPDRPPDGWW